MHFYISIALFFLLITIKNEYSFRSITYSRLPSTLFQTLFLFLAWVLKNPHHSVFLLYRIFFVSFFQSRCSYTFLFVWTLVALAGPSFGFPLCIFIRTVSKSRFRSFFRE